MFPFNVHTYEKNIFRLFRVHEKPGLFPLLVCHKSHYGKLTTLQLKYLRI